MHKNNVSWLVSDSCIVSIAYDLLMKAVANVFWFGLVFWKCWLVLAAMNYFHKHQLTMWFLSTLALWLSLMRDWTINIDHTKCGSKYLKKVSLLPWSWSTFLQSRRSLPGCPWWWLQGFSLKTKLLWTPEFYMYFQPWYTVCLLFAPLTQDWLLDFAKHTHTHKDKCIKKEEACILLALFKPWSVFAKRKKKDMERSGIQTLTVPLNNTVCIEKVFPLIAQLCSGSGITEAGKFFSNNLPLLWVGFGWQFPVLFTLSTGPKMLCTIHLVYGEL